jgi:hypothetical protein
LGHDGGEMILYLAVEVDELAVEVVDYLAGTRSFCAKDCCSTCEWLYVAFVRHLIDDRKQMLEHSGFAAWALDEWYDAVIKRGLHLNSFL